LSKAVGVHVSGKQNTKALEAFGQKRCCKLLGRSLSGGIAVISDINPFYFISLECTQNFGSEAIYAEGTGDILEPGTPEGQGIDDGFT